MNAVAGACLEVDVGSELDVRQVIAGVTHFCAAQQLPGLFAAHVATAASELANNLWMHTACGGRVRLQLLQGARGPGVELVAEDQGPAIADVERALAEGFSTAGGLGCGLPGVQRLMDEFAIDTQPGRGTCVTARKWVRR